jgi:hypothetical protein
MAWHDRRKSLNPVRTRTTIMAAAGIILLLLIQTVPAGARPLPPASPGPAAARRTVAAERPTQVAGSVPAPTGSAVTAVCGSVNPAAIQGPQAQLPDPAIHTLASPSGGIIDFTVSHNIIYVEAQTALLTYHLSGKRIRSFALPHALWSSSLNSSSLVVDGQGNVYVSNYQNKTIDKLSPKGRLLWSKATSGYPVGLFALGGSTNFRLAVSYFQSPKSSQLFDASGRPRGTTPVVTASNEFVTQAPDGDLLVAANGNVQIKDRTGRHVLREFGSVDTKGQGVHTGGPYQFYYQGQAVEGPGGTIYTADPLTTIEASTSSGLLTASTTVGGQLSLAGGYLYLVGGTLFFETGQAFSANVSVSSMSLADLQAYLDPPASSLGARTLGWGAGLTTPAAGNYFAHGTAAAVEATFAPWWSEEAGRVRLSYAIWTAADFADSRPPAKSVALPRTTAALAKVKLTIPARDRAPGPYAVEASLYDTSVKPARLLGSTCLPYTVGAAGDHLDLASLPSGIDAGGAADPRGAVLNAQLGLNGLRGAGIDWSTFLPHCDASAPTAAQCGSTAMTFSSAPGDYFQAAYLAKQDGVQYWIQVSAGDPTSLALAKNGWWQADIEALVSYYTNPPASCQECAAVTAWEPWNEPNNTGFSNGADYVASVLEPFYTAVKAANPSATVIGGSTLGVPLDWWEQLIDAHGLSYLDAAAVHPYTGNNDSWEEDGVLTQVEQLQPLLQGHPLWFTEVGWWSDGDYNLVNQADTVARAMLWQRALGIPVWSYYYPEGSGAPGISFSLIQTDNLGDDYVKPGALATMAASAQTANRPYQSMPSTGIPQTYQEVFGASPGGSTALTAVWSDDLAVTGQIRATSPDGSPVPVTVVSEFGASSTATLASSQSYALPISGQVIYLSYPQQDSLTVGPTDPYGPNLALASSGAKATASSGTAAAAITGNPIGTGWSSSSGDRMPALTVRLASPQVIDRVVIDTQSPGSTATGLRNYTVSVDRPGHGWMIVDRVKSQFRDHIEEVDIKATRATAVRITVQAINYGGYAGGGIPSFWAANQPGVAFVHSIAVYGGTASPNLLSGDALQRIP